MVYQRLILLRDGKSGITAKLMYSRLKKGLSFTDGTPFDSEAIHYNFLDVKEERPDKYTIILN